MIFVKMKKKAIKSFNLIIKKSNYRLILKKDVRIPYSSWESKKGIAELTIAAFNLEIDSSISNQRSLKT